MRERTATVMFIQQQLKQLHEKEHVSDLMKHGQIDKLEAIELQLDYSGLDSYFDEDDKFLELEITEIPEGCHYELAFYFRNYYRQSDFQFFADEDEVIELLEEKQDDLAKNVASIIASKGLCCSSLKELLFGIRNEEETEDDEEDDYDDDYEEEFWF